MGWEESGLHQHVRAFQELSDSAEEARGRGAVNDSMVEGEAEGGDLTDLDAVVSSDGLLADAADTEDGGLWWVEDGGECVYLEGFE